MTTTDRISDIEAVRIGTEALMAIADRVGLQPLYDLLNQANKLAVTLADELDPHQEVWKEHGNQAFDRIKKAVDDIPWQKK
jgi:hypothetical protein